MIANLALVGPSFNKELRQYTSSLDESISQWATANKIPFLSLLPMISNAFKQDPVSKIMIEDDGHPTSHTHALIERSLRPWVVKNLNLE